MKSVLVRFALVALLLFAVVQAAHPAGSKYVADLETNQEVPPPVVNGTIPTGVAIFHIDLSTSVLNWTITHTVIDPIGAHIHAPAPRGTTAPPVITLTTASPIVGNATLTAQQLAWLQNGTMYVNVHTADHPDGVIRGQIEIAPNEYEAVLDAQGVVPPSASNHTGTGVFTYNPSTKTLSWNIVHNVVNPTDAAVHGPAGKSDNAPTLISFASAESPIKGSTSITDDNAKALDNGELYVQINTAQHPSGDIRGHIVRTGDDDSGLSGGVIALIVILVITAVVAVAAGLLILHKKRQKRKFEVVGSQSGDYVPPNF